MTNWRELEAMTNQTVLGTFSERLEFTPYCAEPNGPVEQDTTRTWYILTAMLYWPDNKIIVAADVSFKTRTEACPARVAINKTDYPDLVIRRGDRLKALDRAGQPVLKVGKVTADSRDIIIIEAGQ